MSTTTIYLDSSANAIFIEDANGVQFLNSLQATNSTGVSIHDLARDIDIVTDAPFESFVDENGATYGSNATDVVNALNAIFQSSGTPTNQAPSITSPLTINLTQGQTINYELTANFGVGYEWDFSSVPSVVNVEGNVRKLIGGSSLPVGTYNIPVKAINYNGEDSKTIVLTVSTPPFSNTKSIRFNNNDYCGANASLLDGILGRTGNGSGSSDAWSISVWFKPGTASNANQTIFYFGSQIVSNEGFIQLKYNGTTKSIAIRYGTNNNRLELTTLGSAVTVGQWHHLLFTYDGGTTGVASGSINSYYSRFKIFIDSVQKTTNNTNSNFGFAGSIVGTNLRIGRWNSGQNLRNNCLVDEFAIFSSDQSANISSIYNSGNVFDLSTLTTPPDHWWRMGDGDTYPFLQDSGSVGGRVFEMINMTSSDIVSDVP